MTDDFLTTKEAAAILGCTAERVVQFISEGRLLAAKRGRDYLILRDELLRFAAIPRRRTGRPVNKVLAQDE
jgi:excisionase family DNA binding protein